MHVVVLMRRILNKKFAGGTFLNAEASVVKIIVQRRKKSKGIRGTRRIFHIFLELYGTKDSQHIYTNNITAMLRQISKA